MQYYDEKGNPIKVCNQYGEEIPVIHTWQAHIEWEQEYKKAMALEKICIGELFALISLMAILYKQRRKHGSF